jgi:hypothetical protein
MSTQKDEYLLKFNKRQIAIIKYAVFRFHCHALSHANAAAQDIHDKNYKAGDVKSFMNDADDCTGILDYLRSFESPQDAPPSHATE